MSSKLNSEYPVERDINDLFDEIVLTEERVTKDAYDEGFLVGQNQGNHEGYKLGYAQGLQLGRELGAIYGAVIAHLQSNSKHTEKVQRTLENLRESIEQFPRENSEDSDIIGAVESIRTSDKLLRAMLGAKYKSADSSSSENSKEVEKKDYSF